MSKRKRPTASYIEAAKELAIFAPSLKKYKRRKTRLTPHEKAAIARVENLLSFTSNLVPLKPKEAKKFKDEWVEVHRVIKKGKNKGQSRIYRFPALQLGNTGKIEKIQKRDGNLTLRSNNRQWIYQHVSETTPQNIKKSAQAAFEQTPAFELLSAVQLAQKAFNNPTTKAVYLWTTQGRVGEAFLNFDEFNRWLFERYRKYKNTNEWVKGISILVADVNDKITMNEFSSFAYKRQKRKRKKTYRSVTRG